MKRIFQYLSLGLLIPAGMALADAPRQECIGRVTFDVPEEMQWATFHADYTNRISKGGGHGFGLKVGAKGDNASYDYDGLTIYVSDIVERSQFDGAARYIKGTATLYQSELKKEATRKKKALEELKDLDRRENTKVTRAAVERFTRNIEEVERKIPLIKVHEHDLDIPDAYFLGDSVSPAEALLWRNNRVYYFTFAKAGPDSAERIKALMARFQPRELYEVPTGPGFCLPYGFIADDGKTAYSIKNSLRFTRTPNVIFTLVAASANDPWQTKPTQGTYDTDYRPGYDASKWKKTAFIERLYLGKRLAGLEGWRLDPKPGSGEQERAWFGLAHTGGTLSPLLAVQMFTFQKGTDDLKDLTPPPEEVIPRFKVLSESIKQTLAK
ncbi:T6SS immunity protein Tli4 family protein [Pseudomonas sp. SA3-5]|uniref:T6SS immunity protein Tli4 family protein n=1 Tax=Pseudomonas aestuarii TaxID=3018340 RepID=A0ABT4XFE3_9PSED|nr:T6SS immunity protein Tli4 family protein [Pseudomonas aestuarii]MDA7086904.1 T6SS immunity protein Tli4 family protein [Pseudomonas aestuarii]